MAACLVLASVSVQAQPQRREFNPEQTATRQADRIKETCGTNDEQYKKLYDMFLAEANRQKAQMDSIRANGGQGMQRGNFDREAWQKRQEESNAKIKAILTAEQYAKYEEAEKQRRERMGQRGGGFGGQRRQRDAQQ